MYSETPKRSHMLDMDCRTRAVCWSIWSTRTDGEGGRGTAEANDREVRGVRMTRAEEVSGSELSL